MKTWAFVALAGLVSAPVLADERDGWEAILKQFFEGKSVTVLTEMPATSKGIDVQVGHVEPVDPSKVGGRIADTGVAIREGQRVQITQIKVKKDLIEFQLAGGGFNWFWDTQGAVTPVTGKSRREKDLEDEIKNEQDSRRRRQLQDDLDRERRLREEEERRSRRHAEEENEARHEEDLGRAAREGSRFNLRFDGKTTRDNTAPRAVMAALAPWIDFSGMPDAPEMRGHRRDDDDDRPSRRSHRDDELHNGMSLDDVHELLGTPEHEYKTGQGDLRRVVGLYRDGRKQIEITFVNDVVVKIRTMD